MSEYKKTLNLPKTGFAMKANLAQREPARLKAWQDADLYGQVRRARAGCERYVLHDGPPYANGDIHIGHAVNKVLKDIIIKERTLSGFDAPYVPGWDCHGLPIELMVEKKIGKAGVKVEPAVFRKACRDYAMKQVDRQRTDFKRLGVYGDWDHPYLTMDFEFEANIVRALADLFAAGHVVQGSKPVHWCCDCGSALAEAEVEYEDKTSPAIDVRFASVDAQALLDRCQLDGAATGSGPVSVVIWTTTPWTLPANQAVALNPDFRYLLLAVDGDNGAERLLLAEALYESVLQRAGIDDATVIGACQGADLEGLMLQHPFYDRQVPIILGDHVTTEAGTGAVHTAPGHGLDDYVVGSRYGLEVFNPVGANGCFLPDTELFAGEHVFKANDRVLDVLRERGALLHSEALLHSYPHCWRHKTPIIFRATPQWFVSMDANGLREQAMQSIRDVRWQPDWGQQRIEGMVGGRPDWCISRQRTWGVPIPVFLHKQTAELHPDTPALLDKVIALIREQGIAAWFDLDAAELLGADADTYSKSTDTLDVWFDSGVTHACVLSDGHALGFPADMYLEGSDQHRGWFQSSLLTSVAIHGRAPYKAVLTHGFVVDADGKKMSKSRGNVIAPQKIMNNLGADILRLWVASTDYSAEMHVSDEILKRAADAYRRIRNTARYLLSNLNDFDPAANLLPGEQMLALDRWIVAYTLQLQQALRADYEACQFHLVIQKIHQFCVVELGGFYLDVTKDRQYTTQADSIARRSTQTAMFHVAEALVRWLVPVLSFTADEIWEYLPGERDDSVFIAHWYQGLDADCGELDLAYWQQVTAVRDAVGKELEAVRNAGAIGAPLDAEVDLYCDGALSAALAMLGDELRFVLITSAARLHPVSDRPAAATATAIDGLWVTVSASTSAKCSRCWHRVADVGGDATHPELCGRCITNVDGDGEVRKFV